MSRRQVPFGSSTSSASGSSAPDRHALLLGGGGGGPLAYGGGGAYPRSHAAYSQGAGPTLSRSASPYTAGTNGTDDPYAEYGEPKKGPASYGAYPNAGGAYTATGSSGLPLYAKATNRTAEDLEEQNDQRLEGLSAKVRILKDITLGIGQEVRDGTAEMSTLSEAFSNTGSFLKGTFNRMNRMAGRQTGWFCNMMLFLMLVGWIFVIVWWWRR